MNITSITVAGLLIGGIGMTGTEAVSFARDYAQMRQNAVQSLLKGDIEMAGNRALMKKVCIDASIVLRLQGQASPLDCKAIATAQTE